VLARLDGDEQVNRSLFGEAVKVAPVHRGSGRNVRKRGSCLHVVERAFALRGGSAAGAEERALDRRRVAGGSCVLERDHGRSEHYRDERDESDQDKYADAVAVSAFRRRRSAGRRGCALSAYSDVSLDGDQSGATVWKPACRVEGRCRSG
jgi:hypothetical protein